MSYSAKTADRNNATIRKMPHWKRGQPLRHIKFTPSQEQYSAIRMSSMRMRGFKHPHERDLETGEVTVQGRNISEIISDISKYAPNVPTKVEIPTYYMEG